MSNKEATFAKNWRRSFTKGIIFGRLSFFTDVARVIFQNTEVTRECEFQGGVGSHLRQRTQQAQQQADEGVRQGSR